MSSTHAVECPLGAGIKDNCQADSLEYVVLDIDEKETLQLRSGCDASVHSVCQYHWHKYFEIYITQKFTQHRNNTFGNPPRENPSDQVSISKIGGADTPQPIKFYSGMVKWKDNFFKLESCAQ